MANIEKGEVAFASGGVTYVLRLDMNAIITIQQESGKGIMEVLGALQPGTFDAAMRLILWGMLVDRHPDLTEPEAGRLMPAGGIVELIDKIGMAVNAAFPAPSAAENPRQASA